MRNGLFRGGYSKPKDPEERFSAGRQVPFYAVALLVFSFLFGMVHSQYDLNSNISFYLPSFGREALLLLLNFLCIKPCIFGFHKVHGNATKWKVALEDDLQANRHTRLEFSSNPRFLVSSRESKLGPTGLPANVIMAICLAVTYAAGQMVFLELKYPDQQSGEIVHNTLLSHFALQVLGTVILIQAGLSAWALWSVDIKTWNQSPFATAYILLSDKEKKPLKKVPGRCMHSLYYHLRETEPTKPEKHSAWDSHKIFRDLTIWIWMLIGGGFYWAALIFFMVQSGTPGSYRGSNWNPTSTPSNSTWSNGSPAFNLGWEGKAPIFGLLWGLGILIGFQGGIVTTAMTCAQTLLDLECDNKMWMEIEDKEKGLDPDPHMFKQFKLSYNSYLIHIADPLFHWLFGLGVNVSADDGLQVRPVPIIYICVIGVIGASYITLLLKREPKNSIPATFGHLQTMVDLVDVWEEKMFWGDKSSAGQSLRHAGTSEDKCRVRSVEDFSSEGYIYGGEDCPGCRLRL
ncbi:hypothetical protein VKT23_011603 [Stygiomarasmius scandens]|uniref:Uncharacterized protein n=1 Tax=Marasmiellus scandens TaxID=2682957 RepID=A0ABR1JC28_9AGAR